MIQPSVVNAAMRSQKQTILLVLWILFAIAGVSAQTKGLTTIERPFECEDNEAHLGQIAILTSANNQPDEVLIVIARLGNNEKSSEISRRRLYNAREYIFHAVPTIRKNKIVIALGEKTTGLGRVEFYFDGKIIDFLPVGKNKNLCVDCCENHPIKPYKSAHPRSRSFHRFK